MILREIQEPIKTRYRDETGAARITLRATGAMADGAMSCSVDISRTLYAAAAHPASPGDFGRVLVRTGDRPSSPETRATR